MPGARIRYCSINKMHTHFHDNNYRISTLEYTASTGNVVMSVISSCGEGGEPDSLQKVARQGGKQSANTQVMNTKKHAAAKPIYIYAVLHMVASLLHSRDGPPPAL